jgi:phenylacetate-CoA ligase
LLREAESRTFWSVEQVQAYRDQRLRAFIRHCVSTVPFYRRRFQECGISPDDIQTLADLQRLPILTKEEVQDHYPELVSEAVPKRQQIIIHTSGTTGAGLRFATTLRAIQEQWAIWWRYRRWHGLQPGTWCGYFGGRSVVPLSQTRPPFWRYNIPGKQIMFSAYHMSPTNMGYYVDELRRRRPPWLHGYPSLLALLAAYILESSTDLGYKVRWVTTGAENLLPQQADVIERAFGVRPKQHYGMAEAVANFSECEYGALHVDEDFAAVEFIPNPDGPGFRVIGTNFTNLATPLLRYDVQDIVTVTDAECPCGRAGRVVASIDGRCEDYVILKNGARLGRMDHIFKDMVNIREAQIYQKTPGEIIIRVVRGSRYTETDERALLREARKRVGDDTEILIEYVDRLERSGAGKLRFVISDIEHGQLERITS